MKISLLILGYGALSFALGVIAGAIGLLTLLAYGVIKLTWLPLQ